MALRAASILECIGNTPLLRLSRLPQPGWAEVHAKLELLNPSGSVKDRIALAMVRAAEEQGLLPPGGTLVEPTGGNTGIALAMVAAARGYRLVLTMPEGVSQEHRRLVSQYGAQVVLTPAAEGMAGASKAARELAQREGYFMPSQFENPANPQAHCQATAQEIWEATGGRVDAFVAGVGTGGTLTGVARGLKGRLPGLRVVAVEPARSPFLSQGRAGHHGIPGLGAGFLPPVLERGLIDKVIAVRDEDAHHMAARLAREEGVLAGISSGANVFAALHVAQQMGLGKVVVTILPDGREHHLHRAD